MGPKKYGNKMQNTGLKHAVPNKIALNGQKSFANKPNWLIIPILSLQEAKNWKGEQGYDAIALIDAYAFDTEKTKLENIEALKNQRKKMSRIAKNMCFDDIVIDEGENIFSATERVTATIQQVKKAHKLVKKYSDAIIAAQFYFAPDESKKKEKEKRRGGGYWSRPSLEKPRNQI